MKYSLNEHRCRVGDMEVNNEDIGELERDRDGGFYTNDYDAEVRIKVLADWCVKLIEQNIALQIQLKEER